MTQEEAVGDRDTSHHCAVSGAGAAGARFRELAGWRARDLPQRPVHTRTLAEVNERQIKAVLYVKERGSITNQEYQSLSEVTKTTATRDLSALVSANVLLRKGTTGRGVSYVLKGSGWTQKRLKKGEESPGLTYRGMP